MKIDSILGKLIFLTKEIQFSEPTEGYAVSSSFLTGSGKPHIPFGNLGLQWWYTKKAIRLLNEIAKMAIIYDPLLKNGDREVFSSIISKSLEHNVLHCGIFDGDSVFFRKGNCLFDARADKDIKVFSNKVWTMISTALSNSISNWLLLYPLQRVSSPTFDLGHYGISILNSSDQSTWNSLCQKYTEAKYWDPQKGHTSDGKSPLLTSKPPKCWVVCEINGTQAGARENAGRIIRQFLSVMFAILHESNPHILQQSMASPDNRSIQFPEYASAVGCGWSQASIGTLLPPLLSNLELSKIELEKVKAWYVKHENAENALAHRAAKSSHFIQYASISSDIEKYIHYFIALDALFGERNRVENNIKDALTRIFNDVNWGKRAELLFDLRNELIHGGSSYIEEWSGLEHYENHYNSAPMKDIQLAALTSLRTFFDQ